MKKRLIKYRYVLMSLLLVCSIGYYFSLPDELFKDPYATILNDVSGKLLSARIAEDGQWRFPEVDEIPFKYERAILTFEDQHFYKHPGVNPLALARAVIQNIKAKEVVSGGSTISMQVIRLARKGKSRSIIQKSIEAILATRLEWRYSKKEILNLYASHAPFGGNTVGLEAASWRYFGRKPHELSWAEAALLAVLPNQPALLFPGKNHGMLKAKRDRLIDRLHASGEFDLMTAELAKSEPLPSEPQELPMDAQHLLDRVYREGGKGEQIQSTIEKELQLDVNALVKRHVEVLSGNGVHNAAALVLDIKSGSVLSYVGNTFSKNGKEHGQHVDVINAPRSTGSLLKPFLYASMLDDGLMLPNTLLPDVPMSFGSFSPQNFSRTYEGAIGAKMALARSLNMPAVHMLQQYGYPKFHAKLKKLGMSTLRKPPGHYGLTMILGGSEGTLWDMANIYAGMARTLNRYHERKSDQRYHQNDFDFAHYKANRVVEGEREIEASIDDGILKAASVWFTFEAMLEVYRPNEDASWRLFSNQRKIAWKTGTSFGHRDAWAIGLTPDHVVAVWVGNADGEGRPGLTGIQAAAPILFDIFDMLPESGWFMPPMNELTYAAIDKQSGHLASPYSIEADTMLIPKVGLRTRVSPYHQVVHTDKTGTYRVNGDCESVVAMQHENWFVLPPEQAIYFKDKNPTYQELPPLRNDCYELEITTNMMEVIYPKPNSALYLPVDINGEKGEMVLEVAHRDPQSQLHWHLDNLYVGTTLDKHELSIRPSVGEHTLTVTDNRGNSVQRKFRVNKREVD